MESPNIAIVVLDTLRKDSFARYFEWVPGVRFENAYSTSHWTVPAHASLLTGRYASEVGIHGKSRNFDCPERSIVEVLDESGYSTRMWSANPQIHQWEGWDRGFDQFIGPDRLHPRTEKAVDWSEFRAHDNRFVTYLRALQYISQSPESTVSSFLDGVERVRGTHDRNDGDAVLRRLRGTAFGDREFLLVNLMDAHTPHHPPKPYRSIDENVDFKIGDAFADSIDQPDRNRRAYDDSAAYLSSVYQEIYAQLQLDFDVIVTLSDHGELLGEHGMWNHGYGLYPELVRVPLTIWTGGAFRNVFSRSTRTDVVSVLDIPQTVAGLADIEFSSRGANLCEDDGPKNRLVEYHGFLPWHRDQLKRKGVGDLYEKYDPPLNGLVSASGDYVYQTHDDGFVSTSGDRSDEAIEKLDDMVSALPKRSVTEDDEQISSEIRERLEDLGYA